MNLQSVQGFLSSERPYHMESSPPICNINLLPQFYMVGDLSRGYSQTDRKFNFNTNVVTVGSYMNRSFNFSFSQFPLIAFLVFLKVKIKKALHYNIISSEDFLKLNNLCHLMRKFSNFSVLSLFGEYETCVYFLILHCIIYTSYSNSFFVNLIYFGIVQMVL